MEIVSLVIIFICVPMFEKNMIRFSLYFKILINITGTRLL